MRTNDLHFEQRVELVSEQPSIYPVKERGLPMPWRMQFKVSIWGKEERITISLKHRTEKESRARAHKIFELVKKLCKQSQEQYPEEES